MAETTSPLTECSNKNVCEKFPSAKCEERSLNNAIDKWQQRMSKFKDYLHSTSFVFILFAENLAKLLLCVRNVSGIFHFVMIHLQKVVNLNVALFYES